MGSIILTDAPLPEPEPEDTNTKWEIVLMEREQFGVKHANYPWLRHQEMEPKIKLHLWDPLKHGKSEDNKYFCCCGDQIPEGVMRKFFLLMSTI